MKARPSPWGEGPRMRVASFVHFPGLGWCRETTVRPRGGLGPSEDVAGSSGDRARRCPHTQRFLGKAAQRHQPAAGASEQQTLFTQSPKDKNSTMLVQGQTKQADGTR